MTIGFRDIGWGILFGTLALSVAPSAWSQSGSKQKSQNFPHTVKVEQDETDSAVSWPRVYSEGDLDVTIHQPQIDSWNSNNLEARAAVAIRKAGTAQPEFGVVWIQAHTDIDREGGLVSLDKIELTKVNFPSDKVNADNYLAVLRRNALVGIPSLSLASLQASLAISEVEASASRSVVVKNDPPLILFSQTPAMLLRIDGKPVLRKIAGSNLLRVINTSSLLVLDEKSGAYYQRAFKRWYSTKNLDDAAKTGSWAKVDQPPPELARAMDALGSQTVLFDEPPADIADAVVSGQDPAIYVSTVPAELIQTNGDPEFAPIPGTSLLFVKNTSGHILIDEKAQDYYILVSGRWFRSKTLQDGNWAFVENKALPVDFTKIPDTHPQGGVLASVGNTFQAGQALIDNTIPQMATVTRNKVKPTVRYDGEPLLRPITGTNLQYVINASVPVIRAASGRFYAVDRGVWFVASSLKGAWNVASEIPVEIYSIPASSPLHYVIYVRVYSSTPTEVVVGYTPGYFGTVVAPGGIVVYGTGYVYDPWISDYWYPAPATYGFGSGFAWGEVTGFVFGTVASNAWYGGAWGWGGWYGGNVGINNFNQLNFNNANIYSRWQNNIVRAQFQSRMNDGGRRFSPEQRQSIASQARGRIGNLTSQQKQGIQAKVGNLIRRHGRPNNLYAGRDGQVYRRGSQGWEHHDGRSWSPASEDIADHLNRDQSARFYGNSIHNFRSAGEFQGGGGRSANFHRYVLRR